MNPVVGVCVESALWWAAFTKVRHLRRSPGDLPLRAVVGLCVCLALGPLCQLPGLNPLVEGVATGLSKVLLNLFTVTATYCLMAFYGYSVGGPKVAVHLRNRLFGLLAVMAVMLLAWLSAPARVQVSPGALANLEEPHGAVFTVAALGYMAYGLTYAFYWSVLYARAADRARVRVSLWIVTAALCSLLVACLVKTVLAVALVAGLALDAPLARSLGLGITILVLLGTVLIVTGFCYPAVASAPERVRRQRARRRLYRRLGPLWQRMSAAFPELVLTRGRLPLPGQPTGWLPWTYRAYYRRVIEIRDTLVQLAPYYDPHLARTAQADSTGADEPEIRTSAVLVADALRRRHQQRPVESPYVLPALGGDDLDSDARWLARLAAELEDLPDQPVVPGRSVDAGSSAPPSPVSSSTSSIRRT